METGGWMDGCLSGDALNCRLGVMGKLQWILRVDMDFRK